MRKILAVTLPVLVAACGISSSYTPLNPAPQAMQPRTPELVEVFSSSPPTRPHVDVGLIEVEYSGSASSRPDITTEIMQQVRKEAGARGCDAVHLSGYSARSPSEAGLLYEPGARTVHATCVVYTTARAAR